MKSTVKRKHRLFAIIKTRAENATHTLDLGKYVLYLRIIPYTDKVNDNELIGLPAIVTAYETFLGHVKVPLKTKKDIADAYVAELMSLTIGKEGELTVKDKKRRDELAHKLIKYYGAE